MTDEADKPASEKLSTADSLRRAMALKKKGAGSGHGVEGGLNKKPQEKLRAAQATAANKPAFKKASKRG